MNKKELIKELEKFPDDMEIFVYLESKDCVYPVESIDAGLYETDPENSLVIYLKEE